jgi:hypothetical protein
MRYTRATSKSSGKSVTKHLLNEFSSTQELIAKNNGQVEKTITILTEEFKARIEYKAGIISANKLLEIKKSTKFKLNQILIDALVKENEAIN